MRGTLWVKFAVEFPEDNAFDAEAMQSLLDLLPPRPPPVDVEGTIPCGFRKRVCLLLELHPLIEPRGFGRMLQHCAFCSFALLPLVYGDFSLMRMLDQCARRHPGLEDVEEVSLSVSIAEASTNNPHFRGGGGGGHGEAYDEDEYRGGGGMPGMGGGGGGGCPVS